MAEYGSEYGGNYGPGYGSLIELRPRAETVQVSRGRTSLVFQHNGEIQADEPMQGLYVYNTRLLGRYAWKINGKTPQFSCGSNVDQASWIGYSIETPENCKDTPSGKCQPLEETLELRMRRTVGEGMHEDVHLTNHTLVATDVTLELEFEHQFVSQDEVKKGRKQHGQLDLSWEPGDKASELMADYHVEHAYNHQGNEGVAHVHWGLRLRIENTSDAPQYSENRIRFNLHLKPHEKWHVCLSWLAYRQAASPHSAVLACG